MLLCYFLLPLGTGKTSTIIAAIEEIRARRPELRILACAPSDAAADVIAIRLVHAGNTPFQKTPFQYTSFQYNILSIQNILSIFLLSLPSSYPFSGMQPVHLLRLNWYQRSTASVPVQLSNYCYMSNSDASGGGMYDIPGVIQLLDYQVGY